MKIVDTIYLIAYLTPIHRLHNKTKAIIENLGEDTVVSQASLIELDLLMKSRGFNSFERIATWNLLDKLIPYNSIEHLTPIDYAVAIYLHTEYSMEYFDSLVASQCIVRNAEPLTTDQAIIDIVNRRVEVLEKLENLGIHIV